MQLLESTLSFLVLVMFSLFLLVPSEQKIDNSLYMYELQGDVKNIMHIKGGFENLTKGNKLAGEILGKTGLCIGLVSEEIASGLAANEGRISSGVMIPKIKSLYLSANDSVKEIKGVNLSGFSADEFFFGTCKD